MDNINEIVKMISTTSGSELTELQTIMIQINCCVTENSDLFKYLKENGFTFETVEDTRILQFGDIVIGFLEKLSPSEMEIYRHNLKGLYPAYCSYQKASSLGGMMR